MLGSRVLPRRRWKNIEMCPLNVSSVLRLEYVGVRQSATMRTNSTVACDVNTFACCCIAIWINAPDENGKKRSITKPSSGQRTHHQCQYTWRWAGQKYVANQRSPSYSARRGQFLYYFSFHLCFSRLIRSGRMCRALILMIFTRISGVCVCTLSVFCVDVWFSASRFVFIDVDSVVVVEETCGECRVVHSSFDARSPVQSDQRWSATTGHPFEVNAKVKLTEWCVSTSSP